MADACKKLYMFHGHTSEVEHGPEATPKMSCDRAFDELQPSRPVVHRCEADPLNLPQPALRRRHMHPLAMSEWLPAPQCTASPVSCVLLTKLFLLASHLLGSSTPYCS